MEATVIVIVTSLHMLKSSCQIHSLVCSNPTNSTAHPQSHSCNKGIDVQKTFWKLSNA